MAGGCLVTGGTGFAGSHLIEHLLEHESPTRATPRQTRIDAWANPGGQRHSTGRLSRPLACGESARSRGRSLNGRCDRSIHDLSLCWRRRRQRVADASGQRSLEVNALGTLHLLDAVWEAGLDCPVLVTGSALVYQPSTSAIAEDAPLGPFNPYGVSKLAQEMVASQDRRRRTMVVRSFNHAGPRQSPAYVTSSFASQIAEIEAGLREPTLSVGNLDAARDITDVRDVVRAYRMIVERGEPGRPYNVCSGRHIVSEISSIDWSRWHASPSASPSTRPA